jgi:predicted acetyltransferase
MDKKTFIIRDTTDEGYSHDYDVTVEITDDGTLYSMYYSSNHYWNEERRGEKIMTILDDGDGYIVTPKFGKNMDYAEMAELFAMLSFINSQENYGLYKGDILETKFIKNI